MDVSNHLDILDHIRIRLSGSYEAVSKVLTLEDPIEKHLAMPGYSVNLVFVPYSGYFEDDVVDVSVDLEEWATSHNWSGGHKVLAHELLHIMGLPDEYNRIEVHADNIHMPIYSRLVQFYYQLDEPLLPDAHKGIMSWHGNKPLQRHICASVGLGQDCIDIREEIFGD